MLRWLVHRAKTCDVLGSASIPLRPQFRCPVSEFPGSARRAIRFGVFELDLHAAELRKAGARLNLPAQSFQVLALLLERPGELVTREELRQRLWPDGTFVDFEHGLNAVINRLRDTLGDSADRPRFVETVPRRGYRFIAPVDKGLEDGSAAHPRPTRVARSSLDVAGCRDGTGDWRGRRRSTCFGSGHSHVRRCEPRH